MLTRSSAGCIPRARVICMAGRYADHGMGAIQLSGGIALGLLKGHLFVVVGFWLLQPATLQSGCLSRQPITQTAKQSLGGS